MAKTKKHGSGGDIPKKPQKAEEKKENTAEIAIYPLERQNRKHRRQAAELLVENFSAWPAVEIARTVINSMFTGGRICFCAFDERDNVVGFIGGVPDYEGNVWEIHPLAVRKDKQGTGIGTKLLKAFEEDVVSRGAVTVILGTNDDEGLTSLAGCDIYENLFKNMNNIKAKRPHPLDFYRKNDYKIVGVIPDANGYGKHDIILAKRVGIKG